VAQNHIAVRTNETAEVAEDLLFRVKFGPNLREKDIILDNPVIIYYRNTCLCCSIRNNLNLCAYLVTDTNTWF